MRLPRTVPAPPADRPPLRPSGAARGHPGGSAARLRCGGPVAAVALVTALALVAGWPLLLPGFVNTHHYGDSPFLLLRLIELDRAWANGPVWARWAPDFAYGYGYPFFNFYAPLAYYVAVIVHRLGAGYVAAVELTFLIALVAAALGAYALGRSLWGEGAGLVAAAAYTFAPYHLANVYARGDALGEFSAFAFFPWVLWALHRLAETGSRAYAALAGLLFGGLALTHNTSALAFSPVAAGYALWLAAPAPGARPGRRRALALAGGGLALGLVASSLFWLPALAERGDVHLESMTTGYFDFHNHFLPWSRLVDPHLAYDYRLDGPEPEGLPFRLGALQVVLAALGVGLAAALRRADRPLLFFLAVAAGVVFMLTPASAPVWERVPLLPFLQFPWRLLSVAALACALLAAAGAGALRGRVWPARGYAVGAVALALVGGLGALNPERIAITAAELGPARVFEYEYLTSSLGTTTRFEYLPGPVGERPWSSPLALSFPDRSAWVAASAERGTVTPLADEPLRKRVRVAADRPTAVTFATFWFAGWAAEVDGQPAPVEPAPGSGLARVAVPAGEHEVELRFASTPLRRATELASAVGLLALLGLLATGRPGRLRAPLEHPERPDGRAGAPLVALPATALLLAGLVLAGAGAPPDPPGLQTRAADVHSPLAHRHPEGIAFADGWRLLGYAGLPDALGPDELPQVTLAWDGSAASEPAEVRASLIAPAHLLGLGDRRWGTASATLEPRPGEQRVTLALAGPGGRPPGLYYLQIELRAAGRKLGTLTPSGVASDRDPLLGPIASRRAAPPAPTPAAGSALPELVGAALLAPDDGERRVEVELRWRAPGPIREDLRVSVRLLDAEGRSWGQRDSRPVDGFYPTTLWAPGEVVRDRHTVSPVLATPPGRYRVEARVYSLLDLQPRPVPGSRNGALDLGTVELGRPPAPAETAQLPLRPYPRQPAELTLLGHELGAAGARPGETVPLVLFWRAERPPTRDWRIAVAATAPDAAAARPLLPDYPPTRWAPGVPLRTLTEVAVPLEASGDLPLRVYLVDPASGALDPPDGVPLGTLRVEAPERRFAAPAGLLGSPATFDGKVRFLGYERAAGPVERGGRLRFTLYWQALAPLERRYTVFTHLLDGSRRIVAQRDSQPAGGARPTTGWLPGEVIADPYEIELPSDLPPGGYALEIGLYEPASGARLAVTEGSAVGRDHLVLETVRVVEP